jgi:hypothetical protein
MTMLIVVFGFVALCFVLGALAEDDEERLS